MSVDEILSNLPGGLRSGISFEEDELKNDER